MSLVIYNSKKSSIINEEFYELLRENYKLMNEIRTFICIKN